MDDAGPQSLFVVVFYDNGQYRILQFESQVSNHDTPEQMKVDQIVRINQRPWIPWLLSPPTSFNDNLYMVPHLVGYVPGETGPLHGYKFNFRTGKFLPFNPPPLPSESFGHVVNLRGQIYFFTQTWHSEKQSVFQCYNPKEKSWRALEPFPNFSSCFGPIVGTAVWGDDTILFNVDSQCIWAYVVSEDKWYAVGFDDHRCVSIAGEAVFLKDTIYALSLFDFDSVLALSIVKGGTEGDLVFKCSLISETRVTNMLPILYRDEQVSMRSRHLVHLGEDNFCVVQSCGRHGYNHSQPIQLTYIKLMGESFKTVVRHDVKIESSKTVKIKSPKTVCHDVKIENDMQFRVALCFTLPQDMTTGLKEGKRLVFNFNPVAKDDASKLVQELVDSNRTYRVDSHGEVSRSKMTCSGCNGGEGMSANK